MENLDRFNAEDDRSNGSRPGLLDNKPTIASGDMKPPVNNQELINLILSKIDTITSQTQHLTEAIGVLGHTDWSNSDEECVDRIVDGLTAVVREREITNRESFKLLEKIIDSSLNRLNAMGIDWNRQLYEDMDSKERITFLRELLSL